MTTEPLSGPHPSEPTGDPADATRSSAGPSAGSSAGPSFEPPPAGAPPAGAPRTRYRFVRSRSDRKLGGVCGALARDLDVDPTIVRIVVGLLAFFSGIGIFFYLAVWVLAPKAEPGAEVARPLRPGSPSWDSRQVAGVLLVAFGGLLIGWGFDLAATIPIVMIAAGVAILWQRRRPFAATAGVPLASPVDRSGGSFADTTAPGTDRRTGPSTAPWAATTPSSAPWAPTGVGPVADTATVPGATVPGSTVPGSTASGSTVSGSRRGSSERPRTWPRLAWALLLLGAGLTWLLAGAGGPSATAVAAWFTLGIGAALVIGAWLGTPRGFAFLGVISALTMLFLVVADVSWTGPTGERTVVPTNETLRPYRQRAGVLHVDLSRLDLKGRRATTDIEVSAGALSIEVPRDVGIVIDARAGMGALLGFGGDRSGIDVTRRLVVPERNGAGVVHIRARVGAGAMEIARVGQLRNITPEKVTIGIGDDPDCEFIDCTEPFGPSVEVAR